MSRPSVNQYIRNQVKKLMKAQGIKKVSLGEALGTGKKENRQQQFSRADRFLNGTGSIKIEAIMKLITFFQKPLWYFLPEDKVFGDYLSTSETDTQLNKKPLKDIEKNLKLLGFDEIFIKNQIRQLKAMEAYNVDSD